MLLHLERQVEVVRWSTDYMYSTGGAIIRAEAIKRLMVLMFFLVFSKSIDKA